MSLEISLEELEQCYQGVSKGSGSPSKVFWRCDECCKAFEFPPDEPCKHILELVNKNAS